MSSDNERSFWKSKVSHLPGCIKPLNSNGRLLRKSSLKKETSHKEGELLGAFPLQLSLERVKETALEVIKSHNQEHGLKNIRQIELALSDQTGLTSINGSSSNKTSTDHRPTTTPFKNSDDNRSKQANESSNVCQIESPSIELGETRHSDLAKTSIPSDSTRPQNDSSSHPRFTINHLPSGQKPTAENNANLNSTSHYATTIPTKPTTFPSPLPSSSSSPNLSHKQNTYQPSTTSLTTTPIQPPSQPTTNTTPSSPTPTTRLLSPSFPSSTSLPGRSIRSKPRQHQAHQQASLASTCTSSTRISTYLDSCEVQLEDLKRMSWAGIPHHCRSLAWKLLCSYIPLQPSKRQATLSRKRSEYGNLVRKYYDDEVCRKSHHEAYHQIHIDVPRMSPCIPLFQQVLVQQIFERVLFIWAIRHPASGYVQGMNDLLTPFFIVFITPYVNEGEDLRSFDVAGLSEEVVAEVEADSFWCFSRLLDGIQDNYTFAQPGIQKQVNKLKDLMARINNTLHQHLLSHHIEYLQFAFRWVNNLLMRELPVMCCIRLWDTYLCEPDGFASFHLYVCATLLHRFSTELLSEHDFQGLMLFLKSLPTENWNDADVGLLLADAYRLKYAFADAPRHLVEA